jgi:hypothetical protein
MTHQIGHSQQLSRLALMALTAALVTKSLPAQSWLAEAPSGQIPALSAGEGGAVYNPSGNQLIIFGGGNPVTNSVFVLSNANGSKGTPVWSELTTAGTPPTARKHHSLIYDPGSNRLIVFGGCADYGCTILLNDTWVLLNANGNEPNSPTWTQLTPTGTLPTGRAVHTAVFDPTSNRMVVFGGCTRGSFGCDVPQNDSWVLINATGLGGTPQWVHLNPAGTPPGARDDQSAIFDPDTNRMTVFGGVGGNTGTLYGDVWMLKGANGLASPQWVQLNIAGANPGDRYGAATVYSPTNNSMISFGGVSGATQTNDVWVLSHANGVGTPVWAGVTPSGTPPSVRQGAIAAIEASNQRVMIFGGDNLNDSWVLVKP